MGNDRGALFNADWDAFGRRLRGLGHRAKFLLMLAALLVASIGVYPLHANATTGDLLLMWDKNDGAVPSGWCAISTYDGDFPRGDTVANFGTVVTAPGRPYTPTTNTITMVESGGGNGGNAGSTGSWSNFGHAHPNPTLSYTSEDNGDQATNPNLPAFRTLELIMYQGSGSCTIGSGGGIPNTIPQNAIAMFTSLPSGWTQVSAQNGKMIRFDSTANPATGGGDTEATNFTISGLNAASTSAAGNCFLLCSAAALSTHTHAPPATVNCTAGCQSGSVSCPFQSSNGSPTTSPNTTRGSASHNTFKCTVDQTHADPPYLAPILAKAPSGGAPTLSLNIIGMFDADPGVGWVVLSAGGTSPDFSGQFIRPAASATLTTAGATTHSYTIVGTTGAAAAGSNVLDGGGQTSDNLHTHTVTVTTNTVSNVPPYVDVIIAEKVNFTLNQYAWYVEPTPANSSDTSVSDRWPAGAVNTAANSGILAIPAPFGPPNAGDSLRLRVQILVSGQALSVSTLSFKLQYNQGTATDCLSGSWNDVAANSATTDPWRYGSDIVTDPTTIPNGQTVFSGPASNVEELYQKSANVSSTNPNSATTGQYIEYDWLINDYSATGATQYNFRVVEDHDPSPATLLSVYTFCPSIITRPTTDQLLRHGEFFRPDLNSNSDQGFEWAN